MINELFDLSGKTALITGGRRGIGKALAIGLAKAGVNIVVIGKNDSAGEIEELVKSTGQNFYYFQVNLSNRHERKEIINKIISKVGIIDILINNAGFQQLCPADKYELDMWDNDMELLLTSVLDLSQQVYPYMRSKGGGKIIHIASISSFQGARNIIGYATAKHALIGMTKCMSNEWAKDNINVNAIAPGIIETDMSKETVEDLEKSLLLKGRIPSGKFGKPDDIVGAVIFLASNASSHVHGSVVTVDGGWLGR
mgnify:CR=1 FL=1